MGYEVRLSWAPGSSPAINLYRANEAGGGIGYLTNSTIAAAQKSSVGVNLPYSAFFGPGKAIAHITNGMPFIFPANAFDSGQDRYFLFEGAGAGKGKLILTISQGGTNTIAQTSVFIEIKDVKEMYEQVLIDNVTPGLPPSSLISRYAVVKSQPANGTETPQTVVFVHGINISESQWRMDSETTFKRLYWAGYQGRFASVKWPCPYLPPDIVINPLDFLKAYNYNKGEFYSWKSAPAFRAYLQSFSNAHTNYQINILAHSQGNVLASEAINLGAPFDNYILSQAAVSADCYDITSPSLQILLNAEVAPKITPWSQSQGGYLGYFGGLTGNLINFYNTNDFALATGTYLGFQANWERNQEIRKPEDFPAHHYYRFDGTNCLAIDQDNNVTVVTDSYEKKSMVARSRSRAIGAQWPAAGQTNQGVIQTTVDLGAQFGFSETRPEHSAQFTRAIQNAGGYYQAILQNIQPSP